MPYLFFGNSTNLTIYFAELKCIIKNFGFSLREISILIHDEILCGNIEDIKRIVEGKINELSVKINKLEETKKLLEKVKRSLLSKDMEGCKDMEIYLKK
ncbi:hypothetical protein [Clostridium felsineum]|uniref:Uncharacterized protein n=1 Tax=Clostridium felsineum TaxID=36839 RepID=A0A1S8LQ22_9CLOT|nr:hypothetical protein [Clostridium felsineum]URZ08627.1 hypothetical protein CLROS_040090 [Clostridium felsineum]URZ13658.1 hypothetical protein CROST_044240 [Clostridium felsineum]